MTEEEIKKIAQAYGESVANCIDYDMYADPDFKHKLKARGEANKAEEILQWLLRDYCIVEKSVIKSEYEFNNRFSALFSKKNNAKCNEMSQWHQGKCDELISLFGKSLFEEEQK